jgi:polyhydroxybutyrate depolymerase
MRKSILRYRAAAFARARSTRPAWRTTGWVAALVTVIALLASCGGSSKPANPATIAPAPSSGCQAATPASPGNSTQTFSSVGETGTYIQDVPASSSPPRPMPVVFDLHGYLEAASIEHSGTGLSTYGDSHGFVTITPQINQSGVPRWDTGPNSTDIQWLGNLMTHLEGSLCIDQRRVYVAGLSMGAFATSAVACELSDRVAAVAPVAGLQAYPWCHPSRAVPVVAFQGTADPLVSYSGGPGPYALKLPSPTDPTKTIGQVVGSNVNLTGILPQSIPSQVATWAKRNGCGSHPTTTSVATDVNLLTYPCPTDASVQFYIIVGGGHTWPGGAGDVYPTSIVGKMTTAISANEIMWNFFQAHPLTGHVG